MDVKTFSAYKTYDASCCPRGSLWLHVRGFALIASVPVATSLLMGSSTAAIVCAFVVLLPRLLSARLYATPGSTVNTACLALYWNLVYAICFGSPFFILAACCVKPWFCMPLILAYSVFLTPKHSASHPAEWADIANDWGYRSFREYLPLRLHLHEALRASSPEMKAIFAIHPHGVASDYRILMDGMLRCALPGRTVLTLAASVLFYLPLVRELSLWTRCIDASRRVASRALASGHSLMVIPGGEAEQMATREGVEEVFLAKRKGFVRLALAHNAALVPCYAFGTVDLYSVYAGFLQGPREWLRKRLGVAVPIYVGSCGFLPRRVPVDVVLGEPLALPACATPNEPTEAEVDAAHQKYLAALRRLFEEHKSRFGFADRELKVV